MVWVSGGRLIKRMLKVVRGEEVAGRHSSARQKVVEAVRVTTAIESLAKAKQPS